MTDRPQSYVMYSSDASFNDRFEEYAEDFDSISAALRNAVEEAIDE